MRTASLIAATCVAASLAAQEPAPPPVVGTWDLTLTAPDGRALPSWLEVHVSGNGVLVGRFQGVVGSVRFPGSHTRTTRSAFRCRRSGRRATPICSSRPQWRATV